MTEFGFMGVDWEERIDFDRLRRERLRKAQEALANSDADVLFIFRPEDVRYLTGLRTHMGPAAILHQCTCVLPKGSDLLLFTLDHEHAKARMPWISKETIHPPAKVRSRLGIKEWVEKLRPLLGSRLDGKVGIDLWSHSMMTGLQEFLPNTEFVDGYKILMEAKIIKTRDELECQRAAVLITEAGFEAALRVLKPGIKECEVLAAAWQKFTELGSEWTQCANIVTSGPYTAPYRRFTSDRIIRNGDLVIMDIGACFNGYWGDYTRTFVCGNVSPTPEQKMLHQECYDALFAACVASRPGNTNYHIIKELQNEHSCGLSSGHGAGTNPWEPPWLSGFTPDAEVELRPGMMVNIEPYAGIPGIGGIRLENQVFVTADEPDIYTTTPFDERLLDHVHPLDKTTGRVQRVHL